MEKLESEVTTRQRMCKYCHKIIPKKTLALCYMEAGQYGYAKVVSLHIDCAEAMNNEIYNYNQRIISEVKARQVVSDVPKENAPVKDTNMDSFKDIDSHIEPLQIIK